MLRGINLGPNRRVPMADLRALFGQEGYGDVRTYVQSGNIVLDSTATAAELEREAAALISERFGFDVPVVVRTGRQLAAVVKRNPLGDVADDPKRYQVSFLAAKPAPDVLKTLEAAATGRASAWSATAARSMPGTRRAWRAPSCGTPWRARGWG